MGRSPIAGASTETNVPDAVPEANPAGSAEAPAMYSRYSSSVSNVGSSSSVSPPARSAVEAGGRGERTNAVRGAGSLATAEGADATSRDDGEDIGGDAVKAAEMRAEQRKSSARAADGDFMVRLSRRLKSNRRGR